MYRAREHQCHLCNGSCRSHLLKRLPIAVPEPPGSAAASVFSWHCFRSELPSSSVTLPVNELSWSALPIRFRITETWNSTGKHTQLRLEVLYCSPALILAESSGRAAEQIFQRCWIRLFCDGVCDRCFSTQRLWHSALFLPNVTLFCKSRISAETSWSAQPLPLCPSSQSQTAARPTPTLQQPITQRSASPTANHTEP